MSDAILPISAARVFCDGTFGTPRLAHPEGVAVHPDGSVWCGTENGDLLRILPDGSGYDCIGSTGGFLLGIAFDRAGRCYACDLFHRAVFRHDPATGRFDRFADSGILVPNFPVVDDRRGCLWVSDSRGEGNPGPGIFRYDLQTGAGGAWSTEDWDFANGMCLDETRGGLYVVESFTGRVRHVAIRADGRAATATDAVRGLGRVLDGLALAADGSLYISCYEPGRIYRRAAGGRVEVLIEDPHATVLAHPTNIAIAEGRLYTANLGRWHITEIRLDGVSPALS
jgi:sugar lactone lactonase YvrE